MAERHDVIVYEGGLLADPAARELGLHHREPAAEIVPTEAPAAIRFARKAGRLWRGAMESMEVVPTVFRRGREMLGKLATNVSFGELEGRHRRDDPSIEGINALRTVTEADEAQRTREMWAELENYYDPAELEQIRAAAREAAEPGERVTVGA